MRPNGGHAVALHWSMRNLYGISPGEVNKHNCNYDNLTISTIRADEGLMFETSTS